MVQVPIHKRTFPELLSSWIRCIKHVIYMPETVIRGQNQKRGSRGRRDREPLKGRNRLTPHWKQYSSERFGVGENEAAPYYTGGLMLVVTWVQAIDVGAKSFAESRKRNCRRKCEN